jgi:hypothetical protein
MGARYHGVAIPRGALPMSRGIRGAIIALLCQYTLAMELKPAR